MASEVDPDKEHVPPRTRLQPPQPRGIYDQEGLEPTYLNYYNDPESARAYTGNADHAGADATNARSPLLAEHRYSQDYPRQHPSLPPPVAASAAYGGSAPTAGRSQPRPVQYVHGDVTQKSLVDAYVLCIVLGVLGAHHLYLRRPWFAMLYFGTFGLLGWGWLFDLCRMPCLVRDTNQKLLYPETAHRRNKLDAYVLWFPFGILGFHLFYLRKNGLGMAYFFTAGFFGIAWLIDMFRIPYMVKEANEFPANLDEDRSTFAAYMLWIPPFGVCGSHHFYLRRPVWGCLYFFTWGLFGFGWLVDLFRIPVLAKRTNLQRRGERDKDDRHLDDAYILWFPLGVLGLHHFYLGRHAWGVLYFFTFGLALVGWIIDFCRLPYLVNEYNLSLVTRRRLQAAASRQTTGGGYGGIGSGYVPVTAQGESGGAGGGYGRLGGPSIMVYPSAPPFHAGGSYPGCALPSSGFAPPSYQQAVFPGQHEPYDSPPSYDQAVGANTI